MMKITKRKILNVLLPVFMFAIAFIIGMKTDVKAGTWDNAADYYNTYGDRCIFSVVNGHPRVYFGSAGTIAVAGHTRYRTIGWKVSLYQNGNYQESVYCSLNGRYINRFPSSKSNGTEYNLYYINFDRLKSRFSNQAAINSGAGTLYFDAVMSIVPAKSNTPNGTVDDWGNTTGEVYDTFAGISKARDWGHPDDLRHYYNKSPEGLYRNVYVYSGTGIAGVSGGGTYIYGALATISATCSTGYDFNYWSNSSSSSSSFDVKVTSNLSYTAYGKPQTYTISCNANGGTGAPGNQIKTYGHVLTLSSQKPTRTGYIFNYWNGSDGGTYYPGSSFRTDADTVLTAHWTPITYYVSYNKNKPGKASHDVSGIMTNSKHAYDNGISGNGYSNCLSSNQFSLKGWSFKNWNTKADGTGVSYSNNSNIKNLTKKNGEVVTLYAQWEATTYTITFNSNKPSKAVTQMTGTMEVQTLTYDKWENLHENKYKLEGWTFNKWNLKADGSSETSYKDKERVRNICDGKDTTLYAQWKDTTPPDASKTYLRATKSGNVNDPDYARALVVATKGSKDVTTSTSVTRTLDGLGSSTWTTSWINSDVSLDLYSYDNGTGIKLLTTYSGNNEWNKTKFTPSDNTKQVKSSKYDTSEGIEVFHGIATDDSNNSTATRNLTVKIDKTAPTGSFMVKTGTLKNPLAGTTSMIYDSNGMVTGVNPEGMRTEITATISDNGNESSVSGVKYVWAVVTDMENVNISKSYKCNRISGDKYNGTYIAVDESGNKPNLYEDFSTSRKLKIKVYACDEAGNISVYKDKEPSNDPNKPTSVTPPSSDPENNIVTNISMWSQIIRDDKEVPDTSYVIGKDGKDKDGHSAEGPAFLLNQSGKVHIVTYGYVEAVDVSFPPALQAAAQTDVAKGQTVKNLGTIANVNGAYVDNRLALNGDCARITDYPFIVPLYLDDTSVKTYKTNGDKWLDGITNGIKIPAYIPTANIYMPKKADGTYDIKTVDTVEIPYKGSRTVSGATVPIEPYNKNECDLRTTASFYCAKDYASKQIISITDKLHTHLVN